MIETRRLKNVVIFVQTFIDISQNSQANICAGAFFLIKLQAFTKFIFQSVYK